MPPRLNIFKPLIYFELTLTFQPDDWDEDAPYEIEDEEAEMPEGWLENEPLTIPDPGSYRYMSCVSNYWINLEEAEKPEEWDDEEDGDWIPPTIRNPVCDEAPGCGPWKRYSFS